MQPHPSVLAPAEQDEPLDWRTLALGIAALLAQPPEQHPDTVTEVARQLKTPVTTLRGQAARLMLQAAVQTNADAAREVAGSIVEQADLMSHWVNAILDVQRIHLGKLHLQLRALNFVDVVDECARQAGACPVTDTPSLPIWGDSARLRQAVSAIFDEVAAAFGEDLTVRLTARQWIDGRARAMLTAAKRADPDPQRTAPAAFNLNLYVARELVRMHGGELWADFDDGHVVLVLPLDFSPDSHTVLAQPGPSSPIL
jgi:signal transduction histidine kinase